MRVLNSFKADDLRKAIYDWEYAVLVQQVYSLFDQSETFVVKPDGVRIVEARRFVFCDSHV